MEKAPKGYNLSTTVYNFDLSYNDVGEGNIPVIFLHGFPFDKTTWQPQIDFLKSSYRIITYDHRGFGGSKDEESTLSIDLLTDDLIRFMDKLNIEKAVICGLSMGGYIALNAVTRFPSRFEALVLADTQCIADTPEAKEKRYKAIEEINAAGPTNFNEGFIKNVFCKESFSNQKETVDKLRHVVFSHSPHILTAGLAALAERSETCSQLDKITIPTLILCGREDTVTPLAQAEFMHAHIKGSILQVIDHAGHVSNLEQADVFNQHLTDFLDNLNGLGIENFRGNVRSI